MNISFLDVLDRAHDGPYRTEKEWDTRTIPKSVARISKEHGLNGACTPSDPINSDDSLADRFWEAGLELAVEVGMLCTSTERVLRFSREEILRGLQEAPGYWRAGRGLDAVDVRSRGPEDPQPPTTYLGAFGINIDEDLFVPVMQSHVQNKSLDGTVPGCLKTVHGRELRSGTPFETLGGARENYLVSEALKRAERPGMFVVGTATSPLEYGVFGGIGVDGGYPREQSFVPCLFPSELKIDYHILQKVAYCLLNNVPVKAGTWIMIGGCAGPAEGCVLTGIAAHVLQQIVLRAHGTYAPVFDPRYLGNCGREALWASSCVEQAVSRNTHLLTVYPLNPVSGAMTENILREVTVAALNGTTSGATLINGVRTAGGKFDNRTTGVETGFAGEIVKAAAGMTRHEANEIAKQLLPKYEEQLKRPDIGKTFQECYDVKNVKPLPEWQDIYRKIRKEVAELGVPLPECE